MVTITESIISYCVNKYVRCEGCGDEAEAGWA